MWTTLVALLLIADNGPSVIVHRPAADEFVTAQGKVSLEIEAWSAIGVTRVAAQIRILSQTNPKGLELIQDFEAGDLRAEDGRRYLHGQRPLDLSKLKLLPGDSVQIAIRAESFTTHSLTKAVSLSIVGPAILAKDLGRSIDSARDALQAVLTRQDRALESTRWLVTDLSDGRLLSEARLKRAARDQSDLIADARRIGHDLRRLGARAAANEVLPEAERQRLAQAAEILQRLPEIPLTHESFGEDRKTQEDARGALARALDLLR